MPATVQQAADRWEQNASGAQSKWSEAIQGTQADQAGRAIAAQGAMAANFARAVSSGFWARRVQESGGTANWKAQSLAKASNYGTGVAAGKGKYQQAMSKWLPIIQANAQAVRSMPSGNLSASIARATQFITLMHQAKQAG